MKTRATSTRHTAPAVPASSSTSRTMSRPMSKDKADTLLLLSACVIVLAPHAAHLPWWISMGCGALLLWRSWITFRGNRMPPRWILLPLVTAAMAGAYWTNQTLFGREAGVTMLVLLLALKLLEMRAKRDLFVVVFLSVFLILTNFFYSQSIATAAMMIVAIVLLMAAQLSFQFTGATPPLWKRLRLGATIVGLALPLTLVLFLLFPRIQGPLWGLPGDAQAGRTGLSDSMAPGNISDLAMSSEIVLRARFDGQPPPQPALYWRGPVLGDFDGRTWRPSRAAQNTRIDIRPRSTPVRYQVTLEPSGRRSIFTLELPQAVPTLPGNSVRVAPDLQLLSREALNERVRYDAVSVLDFDLQPNATDASLDIWRMLPVEYNPATLRFAGRLRDAHRHDAQLVDAVLRFFREQNFRYTLQPPTLGRHTVDEFLFGTRAGFCEHYSSAFVVLMRAAGIPARVVTGYQGGEVNDVDGFLTVRQSDAHAWAEVWLEQRGWVRIDPTSAVAPTRIERNLRTAVPPAEFGPLSRVNVEASWLRPLQKLRHNWDALNNAWNQWVLDYTPTRQKSLIESLGLGEADWRLMIVLLLGGSVLATVIVVLPLLRKRNRIEPVERVYASFCHQLARRGLAREPYEGPVMYRRRIEASDKLPAETRKAAAHFLELYETIRYGRTQKALPALLSQLRSLLSQCR